MLFCVYIYIRYTWYKQIHFVLQVQVSAAVYRRWFIVGGVAIFIFCFVYLWICRILLPILRPVHLIHIGLCGFKTINIVIYLLSLIATFKSSFYRGGIFFWKRDLLGWTVFSSRSSELHVIKV